MAPSECFGFINLGNNDEIILEEKSRNPYVKKLLLENPDTINDGEQLLHFENDRINRLRR